MKFFDQDAAINTALIAHCRAELAAGTDPLAVVRVLNHYVKMGKRELCPGKFTGKFIGLSWEDALSAVFGPADGPVRTTIRLAYLIQVDTADLPTTDTDTPPGLSADSEA